MRIHHLAIKVADPEASLAVYAELLGLSELRRWFEPDGRVRSIWLALEGEVFLALERSHEDGRRADEQPGHHCLSLGISASERARWRTRVLEAGFEIERESPYTLYLRDRDGNLLGLSHFPDEASTASA